MNTQQTNADRHTDGFKPGRHSRFLASILPIFWRAAILCRRAFRWRAGFPPPPRPAWKPAPPWVRLSTVLRPLSTVCHRSLFTFYCSLFQSSKGAPMNAHNRQTLLTGAWQQAAEDLTMNHEARPEYRGWVQSRGGFPVAFGHSLEPLRTPTEARPSSSETGPRSVDFWRATLRRGRVRSDLNRPLITDHHPLFTVHCLLFTLLTLLLLAGTAGAQTVYWRGTNTAWTNPRQLDQMAPIPRRFCQGRETNVVIDLSRGATASAAHQPLRGRRHDRVAGCLRRNEHRDADVHERRRQREVSQCHRRRHHRHQMARSLTRRIGPPVPRSAGESNRLYIWVGGNLNDRDETDLIDVKGKGYKKEPSLRQPYPVPVPEEVRAVTTVGHHTVAKAANASGQNLRLDHEPGKFGERRTEL